MELITSSRRNRSSDFSSSFNYMAKKKKKNSGPSTNIFTQNTRKYSNAILLYIRKLFYITRFIFVKFH